MLQNLRPERIAQRTGSTRYGLLLYGERLLRLRHLLPFIAWRTAVAEQVRCEVIVVGLHDAAEVGLVVGTVEIKVVIKQVFTILP